MKRSKGLAIASIFLIFFILLTAKPARVIAGETLKFVFLSTYELNMDIGEEYWLVAVTTNGKTPSFKSSASSVASVNTYGVITAKKAGTAKITARISGAEATCYVTVAPTTVTLSDTLLRMEANRKKKLTAKTSTGAPVTWKSSKKSVAVIDEDGELTTIKPGTSRITATCQGTTASCDLTVVEPTLQINRSAVSLYRNGAVRLAVSVSSGKIPTWRSSKSSVAEVTDSGVVKAIKHGTSTITATVDKVSVKCTVTVKQPTIKLSQTKLTMKPGERAGITAEVSSGNTPAWSSSNDDVATVDGAGNITAEGVGKARIYCEEDGVKKYCAVTVKQQK